MSRSVRGALAVALLLAALCGAGLARGEVVQRKNVRVSFDGALSPSTLPRVGTSPVHISFQARIAPRGSEVPPRLQQMTLEINRHGHFEPKGLPVCDLRDIQPSTTTGALNACRSSLVGEGSFSAKILFAQSAPFPAAGRVYAFNGRLHGRPAILAHVYGTNPVPTSFTVPFVISPAHGTYGTIIRAELASSTTSAGYITGLSLDLGRSFRAGGQRRNYLSAGCPAPAGFRVTPFPFARGRFDFVGGENISQTLTRTCRARG